MQMRPSKLYTLDVLPLSVWHKSDDTSTSRYTKGPETIYDIAAAFRRSYYFYGDIDSIISHINRMNLVSVDERGHVFVFCRYDLCGQQLHIDASLLNLDESKKVTLPCLYQHVFDGQILCGGTGYDYIGIGCSANRSDNKVSTCSSFMPAITKEVSV